MIDEDRLKAGIERVLKDNNVYPVSEPIWKSLTVNHAKRTSEKEAKLVRSNIGEAIGGRKRGVYVYKKEKRGKVLYIGSGWLPNRIQQHYNESYREPRSRKNIDWYDFFHLQRNQGQLNVFWKELDEKLIEKTASDVGELLEHMLAYILEPSFELFRRNRKRRRRTP